jgi:integrase
VFCTEAGTTLDESRVRKVFAQALKRTKLPAFRLCDLVHTFASLLLATGEPITYVSAQLGHADATTTTRWYAPWLPRTAVVPTPRLGFRRGTRRRNARPLSLKLMDSPDYGTGFTEQGTHTLAAFPSETSEA